MSEDTKTFETNWEHLTAELAHLDLLLQSEVLRWRRSTSSNGPDILKSIFISDAEVDHLLGETPDLSSSRLEAAQNSAAALRKSIEKRKQQSLNQGINLALPQLTRSFGLTAFEEQVVVACLAPEVELKYERIYAYLQDDSSRREPSPDLILRLLCLSAEQRFQARVAFSEHATLLRSQILRSESAGARHSLARGLKIDEPITGFLLGVYDVSSEIAATAKQFPIADALPEIPSTEELKTNFVNIARANFQDQDCSPAKMICHFQGREGSGKKSLAARICADVGAQLLVVDVRELLARSSNFETALRSVFREGILHPVAIYIDNFDAMLEDEARSRSYLRVLAGCIDDFSWLTFIGTEKSWEANGTFKHHRLLKAELPAPEGIASLQTWEALARRAGLDAGSFDFAELAAKFKFTPAQMRNAISAATNHSLQIGGSLQPTMDDLYRGCRAQSNQRLRLLSRKLTPRCTWSDITLSANSKAQLREICDQMKYRQKVYGAWGFGQKHSLGRGLCALFFGPSGTGKTMAVEIIAHELGIDAYKVDLSTVVSKYIGETEKNLNKVFSEAETSNAILFFDEADALFGKRSDVKDAHDRYANIEINYLLQRMEEFEGLAILATNLRKNMDEAFSRRMHFAVEFPFPDATQRYAIWKQHFPSSAPMASDIDFDFLATRLNLAGGAIRNIVVNAAFLAAANSGTIRMKHLVQATRREFEKIGRLCTEADFAPYQGFLQETVVGEHHGLGKS